MASLYHGWEAARGASHQLKGDKMKKTVECGVCGHSEATHYHETETVHDDGQGEFMCCSCDHGSGGCQ